MKSFIITFFSAFFLVIGFNFYIDKNFFWHRNKKFQEKILNANECLLFSGEKLSQTDRLAQRQNRKYLDEIQTLILSSSRGAYAQKSMFPNQKIYNFAASISLLEDFVDVWEDLLAQNKIPQKVIFFLDPWIFNETTANYRSFDSLKGQDQFLAKHNLTLPDSLKNFYKREKKEKLRLAILNLFSFEQTQISFELWLKNEYKDFQISPCSDVIHDMNNHQTYMDDRGSHYSNKYPTAMELEKMTSPKTSALSYLDPWTFSPIKLEILKALIQEMLSKNIKVHVLTPLYHPTSFSHIEQSDPIVKYKNVLDNLHNEIEGINICQVYDPKTIGCTSPDFPDTFKDHFKDAIHMTPACTEKLLSYCKAL